MPLRTKSLTLIGVLCATPPALVAQGGAAVPHAWSVLLNPIALADPYGTSLQLGVDHLLAPDLTCSLEGGTYFEYTPQLKEAPDESFTGFIVRARLIYWKDRPVNDHNGVGLDIAFKRWSGTCRDSIAPDGVAPFSKDYAIERRAVIVRAFFVTRDDWGTRFWGEFFGGLGVRFKFSRSTGITDAERDAIDNTDEIGDSSDIPRFQHEVGDAWYPEIVVGMRVGFGWD